MCMNAIMNSENMCRLFKVEYISFTHISVLEKVTMREMFSEYKYRALPFFFFCEIKIVLCNDINKVLVYAHNLKYANPTNLWWRKAGLQHQVGRSSVQIRRLLHVLFFQFRRNMMSFRNVPGIVVH